MQAGPHGVSRRAEIHRRLLAMEARRSGVTEEDLLRAADACEGLLDEYPQTGFRVEPQWTTEVKIKRLPSEDLYAYFEGSEGNYLFTIFRKPLITLVWMGWLLMIGGGLFAAVPFAKKKVGLAA